MAVLYRNEVSVHSFIHSFIHEWCRSRRLQLNPAKTELIWFGSKASLKKTVHIDLNLYIGTDIIKPVVRDLGVFLDSELNLDQHVKTVIRSCFFHLRRLKLVRRILGREVTLGLVSAFVTTRLDYCNSVLAGQLIHFNESRTQLPGLSLESGHGITSFSFSKACTGFRSGYTYSTSCACLCTWCASVAVLPTWPT